MSKVVIKGELPSLNEYIKAERANRYAEANKAKAQDNKQLAKEYEPYNINKRAFGED